MKINMYQAIAGTLALSSFLKDIKLGETDEVSIKLTKELQVLSVYRYLNNKFEYNLEEEVLKVYDDLLWFIIFQPQVAMSRYVQHNVTSALDLMITGDIKSIPQYDEEYELPDCYMEPDFVIGFMLLKDNSPKEKFMKDLEFSLNLFDYLLKGVAEIAEKYCDKNGNLPIVELIPHMLEELDLKKGDDQLSNE